MSKSETESSRAKSATAEHLSDALATLRRGGVIVFPTETLYGLGADALNAAAVERIFVLKGRDPHNPIPVLVADLAMLDVVVAAIPSAAQTLMKRFWPGPLTLVLPARKDLPPPLVNAAGGVGVRISSQPVAKQLVAALGRPLTATSANPAGKKPARTLAEARGYFSDRVEIFLDGGALTSRTGSTVVEFAGERVRMLREGEVSSAELEAVLGGGKVLRP